MKIVGVFVLACVILVIFLQPKFIAALDQQTYDVLTRRVDGGRPSGRVVIVQIDESSLRQYGRWPWPRDLLGKLIQRILEEGAVTVALDMMFPEPDSREITVSQPKNAADARPAANYSPTHRPKTADDFLAESLEAGRVIIGYQLVFGAGRSAPSSCSLHPLPLTIVDTDTERGQAFFQASNVVCSVEGISRSAAGSGFLNAAPESDGVLRRVPLLIGYGKDVYPSLGLAAYMVSQRKPTARLETTSEGAIGLRINDVTVPVDSRSNLLLRFRGAGGTFSRVSAADVLAQRPSAMALRDKIVIVGVSAVGLQDVVATSADSFFPGFEVHATVIDNLLQNDSFRRPNSVLAWELALMLVVGLASGMVLTRIPPIWITPITVALLFSAWMACAMLVSSARIYFSPLPVTAVLVGNLACLIFWRISTEKRRAERQLEIARKFTMTALTSLTAIRDVETGAHVMRVQRYTELLCKAISPNPRFRKYLNPKTITLIVELVPVHDIGKVGIPDHVLRKAGRLTPEEFEIMKTHAEQGLNVIRSAVFQSQMQDEAMLQLASDIVHTHHERWDGTGYPRGLSGDNIPVAGRVLAVADIYDALVSKRFYKEGMKHEDAIKIISEGRGTQFDPDIVDAFLNIHESIRLVKDKIS